MRIALVHSFYRSRQPSGETSSVMAEFAALRRAGFDVELFSAHTDELERDLLYPVRAALRVATGHGASPLDALRRFAPDVVHIHNLFPNFGRRWVEHVEVPVVHTLHNYRPLCANGLLLRDGAVCTMCPDGRRWSGVRYGCYRGSRVASLPLAWANRHGPMADPLMKRADRLIVVSELQREVYEAAGVPRERMVLSPYFLPEDLDIHRSDDVGDRGWVFVGRLSEEKGLLPLLERWPSTEQLTIIGDGPQRADIERVAARCSAVVAGGLPRQAVLNQMHAAVGLVFPSLWYEASPLVYVEALACGLPVVGFEPSAVARAVRHDGTGAALSWADDLVGTLGQVREARAALAGRCRSVFEEKYSEAGYVDRSAEMYRSLVNS